MEANFKQSHEINPDYFYNKIVESNKTEKLSEINSSENPTIAGTFSNWKCKKMMKVDKFYDCLIRNKIPNGRIYVKNEVNDLTTKISKILNKEIFTIYRNQK